MTPQKITSTMQDRLPRTVYFMGGYLSVIAAAADTDGTFALLEMNLRRGLEPPAHTHTHEDESFTLLEGEMCFEIGGQEHYLHPGDFIRLPRGIAHSFRVLSPTAKTLVTLVPAGLEAFFLELGRPADALDFPELPAGPPSPGFLQKVGVLQERFGIVGMRNEGIRAGV